MEVLPYNTPDQGKKKEVALMFDNIARRYDLLNHLLSFNIDRIWRRKAIAILQPHHPRLILDVATGTGDFALAALQMNPEKVTGVDISEAMLAKGVQKILRKGLQDKIEFRVGDAENLPFPENTFDGVISGFGVRNFEDTGKGIREMCRVLRKGGRVVILEFSMPRKSPFRQLYRTYFSLVLPMIGRLISRDRSAYTYLPDSVNAFPDGERFLDLLRQGGFGECTQKPLTFGVATIYTGLKM